MSITTKFPSQVKTFEVLFQQAAMGYYIPSYQRPYSWNNENVAQLLNDIISGTFRLVKSSNSDEEYRFLGTIITVTVANTKARQMMYPVDDDAVPTAVNFIIDGQQRISTVSILAMVLYDYISTLAVKISKENKNNELLVMDDINELCMKYLGELQKLFSMNLSYGRPLLKPVIIRADDDKWTRNGTKEYKSDLACTLSDFCIHVDSNKDGYKSFTPVKTHLVGKNYAEIYRLLRKSVERDEGIDQNNSDNDEEMILPAASEIIMKDYLVNDILAMKRQNIIDCVQKNVVSVKQFVQILAMTHFILKRCLVNHVQPDSETWAFDMFQSLNSTGEPLTAFDIFKAVMLQKLPDENRNKIKENIKLMYDELDELLGSKKEEKSRKTKELLIILGLSYKGEQVNKLTSEQKQWLTDIYETTGIYETNGQSKVWQHYQTVIRRIRRTMIFIESIKKLQESKSGYIHEMSGTMPNQLRDEAMFCLLFLKDAGHSIVDGVLNNALFQVLEENKSVQSMTDFCNITRAVTAFYALWWPIHHTSRLPKIHRDIMKLQGWGKIPQVDVHQIKQDLKNQLLSPFPNRETWIESTVDKLRYGAGSDKLVKLALFVSMWNTTLHNGHLTALRGEDVSSLLTASRWCSDSFASIEHIAPQTQTDVWDKEIYPEYVHRIGNLVLLPTEINSGTGNRSWKHKWIYYSHTAETDILKQKSLRETAFAHNITLDDAVVKNLQKSTYNQHLQPILQLGISYNWDKQTIEQRSRDICALLYDRMMEWLS
jgi:hypothetical protein